MDPVLIFCLWLFNRVHSIWPTLPYLFTSTECIIYPGIPIFFSFAWCLSTKHIRFALLSSIAWSNVSIFDFGHLLEYFKVFESVFNFFLSSYFSIFLLFLFFCCCSSCCNSDGYLFPLFLFICLSSSLSVFSLFWLSCLYCFYFCLVMFPLVLLSFCQ